MTAPIGPFRRFLLRHCSSVTIERLVDPILTDIRIEAAAAAARRQQWANRRIRAAGTIALSKALTCYGWTSGRFVSGLVKTEVRSGERWRIVRLSPRPAFRADAPFLVRFPANRLPELSPYLVPQALPIAVPVGLFIGLIYGFRAQIVMSSGRYAVFDQTLAPMAGA